MIDRIATTLLIGLAIGAASAQGTRDSGRVSPEGPYQSQVRILDEEREPVEASAEELLRNTHEAYGRALILRQLAQRGIAAGDTATAIAYYEQALALDSLAPLAAAQMQINLGQLYALDGRHADAVRLLESAAAVVPLDEPELLMTLANSLLQTGRPDDGAARAVRALTLAGDRAPAEWVEFAVFALWQSGAPAAAAQWQLRRLAATPASPDDWMRLAALYYEAGDTVRALATLHTAAVTGMLTDEADWLRLVQLHVDYGTPDLAAQWLEPLVSESGDPRRWHWLAQVRLRAHDEPAALAALMRRAELDGTPDAWLEAGELAAGLGEDDQAANALQRAAGRRADGAVRARALLLLGQVEAARGRYAAARRAFEQASEYGGVYKQASEWLAFLPAGETEADTRASQSAGTAADTAASAATTPTPVAAAPSATDMDELAVKTVPSLRVFAAGETVAVTDIAATARDLAGQLVRASRRDRLEWTGPLHVIVTGDIADQAGAVEVRVAAPIRRGAPPRGEFRSDTLENFRCVWRRFEGPPEDLPDAWRDLYERTLAAGHVPAGEARQVVLHRGSDTGDAVVELQIGIL